MKSTDESPREFWIAMTDFRLAFAALRTELRDRFQRAEAGISSHPDLDRDRTLPLGKQIAFRTALELVDEFEDKISQVAHDRPSGRCVDVGDDFSSQSSLCTAADLAGRVHGCSRLHQWRNCGDQLRMPVLPPNCG